MRLAPPLAALFFTTAVAAACGGGVESTPGRDAAGAPNQQDAASPGTNDTFPVCGGNLRPSGACIDGARCKYASERPAGEESSCVTNPYGPLQFDPGPGSCECLGGQWSCVASKPSARPPTMCPDGARILCAYDDACYNNCGPNEECFTQVACRAAPEGGVGCGRSDGLGDDRCHLRCTKDTDCPVGEDCIHPQFWGCTGDNGDAAGKALCCRAGSNCQ